MMFKIKLSFSNLQVLLFKVMKFFDVTFYFLEKPLNKISRPFLDWFHDSTKTTQDCPTMFEVYLLWDFFGFVAGLAKICII
jgi:hypothetical protein